MSQFMALCKKQVCKPGVDVVFEEGVMYDVTNFTYGYDEVVVDDGRGTKHCMDKDYFFIYFSLFKIPEIKPNATGVKLLALCTEDVVPVNDMLLFKKGFTYSVVTINDENVEVEAHSLNNYVMDLYFFHKHFSLSMEQGESKMASKELFDVNTNLKKFDLSHERYREYDFNGRVYRIDEPVALIIRPNGVTHRVIDKTGKVHCLPAPGHHGCVIRWEVKMHEKLVKF